MGRKKYHYQGYPGNLCKHPDCYFRRMFTTGFTYCAYACITNTLRKTPAEVCDKYLTKAQGKKLYER